MRLRRPTIRDLLIAVAIGLAFAAAPPALWHLRALYVLEKLADAKAQPVVAPLVAHAVDESQFTFPAQAGSVRARLYTPRGVNGARGMVIVHGVHFLGMDEPRLMSFARSIAVTGVVVMTPEITELKDFRIEPRSVATIGAAAQELARRTGHPVGVTPPASPTSSLSADTPTWPALPASTPPTVHPVPPVPKMAPKKACARILTARW